MQDIKSDPKTTFLHRALAVWLMLGLTFSGFPAYAATPAGDVSVEGNSAAIQNIGRAMQSPDARPANAPTRSALRSQPTIVLPDMGDPGGDALSSVNMAK
jgi:hypothetical protein